MPELDTITAKLTADVSAFQTGMASANQSVENFKAATTTAAAGQTTFYRGLEQSGEYAAGAERGVRRIEYAMGALAAPSGGAHHPIRMLAEGVLAFGRGC